MFGRRHACRDVTFAAAQLVSRVKHRAAVGMYVSVVATSVESFEEHWPLLVPLTYRTQGSLAKAEVVVQAAVVLRNKGVIMVTQRVIDEADIRKRIDTLLAALRAMDLEGVMSIYAPDIVSFDIAPPLRQVGADAKRKNWMGAFAMYQRPLGYEMRDLTITVGDDVAFSYSLNRISGTLQNGNRTDFWLRWTACFQKIEGAWLIVHDHVSVPVDFERGRALLDLEP